jgi:hypothetical protein
MLLEDAISGEADPSALIIRRKEPNTPSSTMLPSDFEVVIYDLKPLFVYQL